MSSDDEKTSAFVKRLGEGVGPEGITIKALIQALQDRGFAAVIIVFALPNVVIPGLSLVLGLPVLFCGCQMAAGRENLWLPGLVSRQTLSQQTFQKGAKYVERFLLWIETRSKSRLGWIFSKSFERVCGMFIVVSTLFLMTPVPFGNALPALGISLLAVALIERDGVALAFGTLLNLIGACYICIVLFLGLKTLKSVMLYFE